MVGLAFCTECIVEDIPVVEQILDLGRWSPSGDNAQPWRFEIIDDRHIVIHGHDTRTNCIYDLNGRASQISLGALIETITIGATRFGRKTEVSRRVNMPDDSPTFDVAFEDCPNTHESSLVSLIRSRCVQRRPLSTRSLSAVEKDNLQVAVGTGYTLHWLEGIFNRFKVAKILFTNARLRLRLPEAFETHIGSIEWGSQFSETGLPDQALGASKLTLRIMEVLMRKWKRVNFFNKYLGGTLAPAVEMDFIPSIACGAHFIIVAKSPARTIDNYVNAGRALQRFWLTAARIGLQLQPELTPLIFSRYDRDGIQLSKLPEISQKARQIKNGLADLVGRDVALSAVFMGRIGAGKPAQSRSIRKPLADLIVQ
jgi:hypothetical protein